MRVAHAARICLGAVGRDVRFGPIAAIIIALIR
jgi:hypothetical protein